MFENIKEKFEIKDDKNNLYLIFVFKKYADAKIF